MKNLNAEDAEQRNSAMQRQRYIDLLTGAYSRGFFEDCLDSIKKCSAVCLVDVDEFKRINDNYGYSVGDSVLKGVTDVIRKRIRNDDILIRYGGDEFLLIFADIPKDVFITKMELIRDDIDLLTVAENPKLRISISMGCVYNENNKLNIDELMKQLGVAKANRNAIAIDNLIHSVGAAGSKKNSHRVFTEEMIQTMFRAFNTDFNVIMWVDPDGEQVKVLQASGVIPGFTEKIERMTATEYRKYFATEMLVPEDGERFLRETEVDVMQKHFEQSDSYFIDHRMLINGVIHYYQTKIVKMPTPDAPRAFLSGGHSIDSVERQKIRENDKSKEQVRRRNEELSIISALADDFDCVAYIDYARDYMHTYRVNDIFRAFEERYADGYPFSEKIRLFAETFLTEEEKSNFLEGMSESKVKKAFRTKDKYFFDIRVELVGRAVPYQVKFVKIGDDEAVLGVRSIEEEKNYERNRENRMAQVVQARTAELMEKNRLLRNLNENIVDAVGNIVEARDAESGEHIRRVKGFTGILAGYVMDHYPEYGLTKADIHMIVSASALHDVGKIMIPDGILLKPARLTPDEFEIIKTHSQKGCEILSKISFGWSEEYCKTARDICLNHHEKWDGKGYPNGISGDAIPISAQIVSVADCFDALTAKRVYKEAMSVDEAYETILSGKCGAFSDRMLQAFKDCREELVQQMYGKDTANAPVPALNCLEKARLLLVEDSDLNREITKELLESEGAVVCTASNGAEAIDVFRKDNRRFDAILMDINMPVMNGYEATKNIRKLETKETGHIPIIALSSAFSAEVVDECRRCGMDLHMMKPMSITALKQVLLDGIDESNRL